MASNKMNNFLINNWNGRNFGKPFYQIISDFERRDLAYMYQPYFFLKRELAFTQPDQYQDAKRNDMIRHAKYYRGMWLDYVVGKEFDTLDEWAEDCGADSRDILYGVNRFHMYQRDTYTPHPSRYVTLTRLLDSLGYVCDYTFTELLEKLESKTEVPEKGQRCLVKRPDGSIVIARVMDKKFESIDPNAESEIVIRVRIDNDGNTLDYGRLSELPQDMTVYFRTTDDEFCAIKDLM
jgi:hypothetical protein